MLEPCWVKQGCDFATEGKGRKQEREISLAQGLLGAGLSPHTEDARQATLINWVPSDTSVLRAPSPAQVWSMSSPGSSQASSPLPESQPRRLSGHTVTKLPHELLWNLQLKRLSRLTFFATYWVFYFLELFQVYKSISHLPLAPTHANLPHYHHPHRGAAFLRTEEPTLTHHDNPKSTVHLTVHSWYILSVWTNV